MLDVRLVLCRSLWEKGHAKGGETAAQAAENGSTRAIVTAYPQKVSLSPRIQTGDMCERCRHALELLGQRRAISSVWLEH
jgi:hypothetical protein